MNDRFAALEWTPEGRRARGRPKTSRRRTVEREGKAGWKSWNLAKAAARDKKRGGGGGWADNVMALCALWRNER